MHSFSTTGIACDGVYLYVYVSAVEGGVYKIGTGVENTVPGKIYLQRPISKADEISLVCLKGRLILRSTSKEVSYSLTNT